MKINKDEDNPYTNSEVYDYNENSHPNNPNTNKDVNGNHIIQFNRPVKSTNSLIEDREYKDCKCPEIAVCILLGLVGFMIQPLYLMFYILYGMMECYRRFGCWIFWAGSY